MRHLRMLRKRWMRISEALLGPVFPTVVGVRTAQALVALTFDDGPHPVSTPLLLEVLERYGARGTFFMVGRAAELHPEVVLRVSSGGHAVGNHTLEHRSLPTLPAGDRRAQIDGGAKAIGAACSRLFRPPFGHQDLASWWTARRLGYRVVTWSAHCRDWRDDGADVLLERLRVALRPGAIVLLHDALYSLERGVHGERSELATALERLLAEQSGRMRFVTVPELLASGKAESRAWWKRGDPAWLGSLTGAASPDPPGPGPS